MERGKGSGEEGYRGSGEGGRTTVNDVYKAWGGTKNFMLSHGIKPVAPEGFAEAREIAEAFARHNNGEADPY